MPQPLILKRWNWMVLWRPTRSSRINTQKRCPFHYRGLECKRRKLRKTWINGKFGLGIWNEAGQRLIVAKRTHWSQQTPSSKNTREDSIRGHHQMVNTEIRFIIFFAAKDGEALYSQQKQDREMTVVQIMNSLLPNSDLNWRKWGKPLDHSGIT